MHRPLFWSYKMQVLHELQNIWSFESSHRQQLNVKLPFASGTHSRTIWSCRYLGSCIHSRTVKLPFFIHCCLGSPFVLSCVDIVSSVDMLRFWLQASREQNAQRHRLQASSFWLVGACSRSSKAKKSIGLVPWFA